LLAVRYAADKQNAMLAAPSWLGMDTLNGLMSFDVKTTAQEEQ
jgi:hypothetical protein